MSTQPLARRAAGAALAVFLFTACSPQSSTAAAQSAEPAQGTAAASAAAPPVVTPAAAGQGLALPDFAGLVERFGPAVVNVSIVGKREAPAAPGMSPDDPLYEFFRRFGMPGIPGGGQRGNRPPARGEGSGFITVRMTDRREYTAKVVGLDQRTDVAVLKIEATQLPVVRIGNPAKLRPGQWVVAIGSPFGFDNSVTAGIVSATARDLPGGDSNYVPFIQTDVAVNPGNSGGPLFNLDGEVVGINSQIYSRTGGYMGLSFAIPIDLASDIKDQLVRTGRVSRGRIGVSIQEVNAQFAESFGLERPRGALVGSVESGGPADKGGVKAGDIILSVNGRPVERSAELPTIIAAVRPGADATLEVWRERSIRKLTVRVAELKEESEKIAATPDKPADADRLGLVVRELSADEQRSAETTGSIYVERVDGPAEEAGVRPGDIILGVNGRSVKALKDLREAVAKAGKTVALLVQREGVQIFLPIRAGG
jgi:serine protease Do